MYIDANTIIKAASLLGALAALVTAVIAVYKVIENNKRQTEIIKEMREEQTLICFCLKNLLQGMIENGFNGPCKEALGKLEKHLNQSAHKTPLEP